MRARWARLVCRLLGHRIDPRPTYHLTLSCTRCPAWWGGPPRK